MFFYYEASRIVWMMTWNLKFNFLCICFRDCLAISMARQVNILANVYRIIFFLNQIKLLYFTLCWLSKDGNKIQRKWLVKRDNIWLLLTCCLFLLILLDTSSSIDKSVPLEMPNQRSAAAQAQGTGCIWSTCFSTSLPFYFIRL